MKRTIHLCALLFLTFIVINNVAAKVDLSNPKQPKNNLLQTTEKIAKVLKKELRILEKRATDGMSAKQRNTMVVDMAMKMNEKQQERMASSQPRFAKVSKITPDQVCGEECIKAWTDLANTYDEYFKCNPKCEQSLIVRKVMQSEHVGTICSPNLVCWGKLEEQVFSAAPGGGSGPGAGQQEQEQQQQGQQEQQQQQGGASAGAGDHNEGQHPGMTAGSGDHPGMTAGSGEQQHGGDGGVDEGGKCTSDDDCNDGNKCRTPKEVEQEEQKDSTKKGGKGGKTSKRKDKGSGKAGKPSKKTEKGSSGSSKGGSGSSGSSKGGSKAGKDKQALRQEEEKIIKEEEQRLEQKLGQDAEDDDDDAYRRRRRPLSSLATVKAKRASKGGGKKKSKGGKEEESEEEKEVEQDVEAAESHPDQKICVSVNSVEELEQLEQKEEGSAKKGGKGGKPSKKDTKGSKGGQTSKKDEKGSRGKSASKGSSKGGSFAEQKQSRKESEEQMIEEEEKRLKEKIEADMLSAHGGAMLAADTDGDGEMDMLAAHNGGGDDGYE